MSEKGRKPREYFAVDLYTFKYIITPIPISPIAPARAAP